MALIWALAVGLLLAHNGYLWLVKGVVPDTDILALLPVEQQRGAGQASGPAANRASGIGAKSARLAGAVATDAAQLADAGATNSVA